ncbi:MAG: DUF3473 domain-containing protein, partial [bacterium]
GIEKLNAEGKPAIIYFHPWELDPQLPRINVGKIKRLRHYGNLALMEERIANLLGTFRFGTVEQVLQQTDILDRWPRVSENGRFPSETQDTLHQSPSIRDAADIRVD